MSKKSPRNKSSRAKQLARQKAARTARSAGPNRLWDMQLPFTGYREWFSVPGQRTQPLTAEQVGDIEAGALDLLNTVTRLGPVYGGSVPKAALYLDEQIQDGQILMAVPGQPDRVNPLPVAVLAASQGLDGDGTGDGVHELHAHGYLVVDDEHLVHVRPAHS